MYTLDTNAIIYYLKNDIGVVSAIRQIILRSATVYISAITELELFSFPSLSRSEEEQIEVILKSLAVIPLDSRIARIAGFLRRSCRLKVADSIVAATALFTGTVLVTRNIRDFRNTPELRIEKI